MKSVFLTDDRILVLTLVKVKNAVFDNPRTPHFKSKYECLDEFWLWTVCQVCVPSPEDVLASKSRLGDGTCSRRCFCPNWKASELFGSAVPPLGREGAGRNPQVLLILTCLSPMAERPSVRYGFQWSWWPLWDKIWSVSKWSSGTAGNSAWKRRFCMPGPFKLYSVVLG